VFSDLTMYARIIFFAVCRYENGIQIQEDMLKSVSILRHSVG